MQRLFFLGVAAVLLTCLASPATADTKRHLVYDFTVGIVSDQHAKDNSVNYGITNANGGAAAVVGTGDTSYRGNVSDKGEIIVDYQGVEADGGLVVNVAETARTNRTLAAQPCVVYANTNVICGGNTYPEEIAVLRTLSPKFFDPTHLDADHHWNVSIANAGVSIDFRAAPQGVGMMTIDSQRNEKQTSGDTSTATAKYSYASGRLLPTDLKEYTTMRQETGPGQYINVTIDITANLSSDSLAMKS